MPIPNDLQIVLHQFITGFFNIDALRLLCLRLDVSREVLSGPNLEMQALSLIDHFDRVKPTVGGLLKGLAMERPEQFGGVDRLRSELVAYTERLEGQGEWDEAEAIVFAEKAPVPQELTVRFEQRRAAYRRAQELEQVAHLRAEAWDEARSALIGLERSHPRYRDAPARLTKLKRWEGWYREAAAAWQEGRWGEASAVLGKLVGEQRSYKDAAERLANLEHCGALVAAGEPWLAQPRQIAAGDKWEEVAAIYRQVESSVPGYAKAADVLSYLAALRALHERRWEEAERGFEGLAADRPGFRPLDIPLAAVRCLRETVEALSGGFVRDPSLRWVGSYPYDVLRQAGQPITAGSSMATIGDAGYDLQREGMAPERRQAWDALREIGQRLFVDAFLYRCANSGAVAQVLKDELATNFALPSDAVVAQRLPQQLPLLHLLWNRRQEAAAGLEARFAANPREVQVAHHLALLHLVWAEELDGGKPSEGALSAWRKAIGYWALSLLDDAYLRRWAEERAAAYGRPVSPSHLEALRDQVEEELRQRLGEAADRRAGAAGATVAAEYRTLRAELRGELAAVRLIKTVGGLPAGNRGSVTCGPLLLATLGLEAALAGLTAGLTEQENPIVAVLAGAPSQSGVRRLRQLFSCLKLPAALLDGPQPDPAGVLALLAGADCGECPPCGDPGCPLHSDLTPAIRVCCDRCPRFVARNPAYAALAHRGEWLHEDAVHLATESHLKAAEEHIHHEAHWSLAAIRAAWQDALSLSRHWGGEDEVRERVGTMALAGAAAIGGDPQRDADTEGSDRAVALLEAASELTGDDPRLVQRLAEQLTSRGIRRANRNDHRGAVEDLERAVRLAPHSQHAHDQLAAALAFRASDLITEDREQALELLDRAQQLVDENLRLRPDDAFNTRTSEAIRHLQATVKGDPSPVLEGDTFRELDALLSRQERQGHEGGQVASLLVQAALERRGGKLDAAVETLRRAWDLAPEDRDVQDELVSALTERAGELISAGRVEQQQELIDGWRRRLAGQRVLAARLDFLQWGSLVKHYLDQTDLKYRQGARQVFLVPFDSAIVGTLMVRVAVEGDAVCVTGTLPPLADADEATALANLLQGLGEVMFFRPAQVEGVGLVLITRMAVRYLNPGWMRFLVRGMALLANVQPVWLLHAEQLRAHLKYQREILRLMRPAGRASLEPLAAICRGRRWQVVEENSDHGRVESPLGAIEATLLEEGVRMAMPLGYLRAGEDRRSSYRRVVALNYRLGGGKLVLDDSGRLALVYEIPDLDEAAFTEAVEAFSVHRDRLVRDLTQG